MRVNWRYSRNELSEKSGAVQCAAGIIRDMAGAVTLFISYPTLRGLPPGQRLFFQRGISESGRIGLICSESYVKRRGAGSGGVGDRWL